MLLIGGWNNRGEGVSWQKVMSAFTHNVDKTVTFIEYYYHSSNRW